MKSDAGAIVKTKLLSSLCLSVLGLLLFVPNIFAQGAAPHHVVRLIYFVPTQRQPQPDINTKLDGLIKNVQQFYADEMERHGFGRKTFQFETDGQGNAVVHRVNGQFRDTHYHQDTASKVLEEVSQRFNFAENIYLLVIDVSTGLIDSVCGRGGNVWDTAGNWGGNAFIPASGDCLNTDLGFELTAHELGHAFGLPHNFKSNAYIMSYGEYPDELAPCTAEWLNANRYFNDQGMPANQHETTIEMFSPASDPDDAIRFRFKISDADGLRHSQLMTPATSVNEDPGSLKLLACQALAGNSADAVFATSQLTLQSASVTLSVVDATGHLSWEDYPIDMNVLLRTSRVVSIPDVNLAAAIRNELGLSGRTRITHLDMLSLTGLNAAHKQIVQLDGLEHAKNLKRLSLGFNQITDLSPLAQLRGLEELSLAYNPVEDLTLITGLTQLRSLEVRGYNIRNATLDLNLFKAFPDLVVLNIGANGITDITPLAHLKRLRYFAASGNQIQDITTLAQMPNLVALELWDNSVSDLTPLKGLIHLERLGLPGNPITDLTPIRGLKRLKDLDISGRGTDGEITDLTSLANLTNLESLRAARNHIRSIRPIRKLTHLTLLFLEDNRINDMRPVTKLVNLTALQVAGNPIADLTPLQTLSDQSPGLKLDIKLTQLSPTVERIDSQLPPLYWVDAETTGFYRLVDSGKGVEHRALGVSNITAFAVDSTGGTAYWIEQTGPIRGEIGAANLDGSNTRLVRALFSLPLAIAIDTVNSKIYCTNANNNIQRLNFNGSNFEAKRIAGLDAPKHIALNVPGGKLYWTEAGERIRRADLNGSNIQTLATDLGQIGGITIAGDKLYWTEQTGKSRGQIRRANLDGTNIQTFITLKNVPLGIAVDMRGGNVYWTNAAGRIQRANLNGKNIQNVVTGLAHPIDLVLGTDAGATLVAAAPAITLVNSTDLLPNYPNPFNPETWIPYQLAKPADVTLRIYTATGVLVRTLALGHQPAGFYQNRSRAAYWDGRNEFAEPVASGVYFYTLSAGDFTATRKMLIVK